jgi:20S proteasome alpha/beta subunit
MSLEIVSEKVSVDRSGYAQEQNENNSSTSIGSKNSIQNQESRNDRNLSSSNQSKRISATKSHIAFSLSFVVKLQNRTPFDPNQRC